MGNTIKFNLNVDNFLAAALHNNDSIYIHTYTCFSWLMLRAGDWQILQMRCLVSTAGHTPWHSKQWVS